MGNRRRRGVPLRTWHRRAAYTHETLVIEGWEPRRLRPGSQAAAHVFQLAGGNGNAQGIADPPPTPATSPLPFEAANYAIASVLPLELRNGIRDRALAEAFATPSVDSWVLGERGRHATPLRANRLVDPIARFSPTASPAPRSVDRPTLNLYAADDRDHVEAKDALFGEFGIASFGEALVPASEQRQARRAH